MRSGLPKVLHHVAGDPIISHVLDVAARVGVPRPVMVVGHMRERVAEVVGDAPRYVIQEPQLGTGHALQLALAAFHPIPRRLLVLYGDTPLLTERTVSSMVDALPGAVMVLLTARYEDPAGYGRVVRDERGLVSAVVEEADARPEQLEIREVNSGMYSFDGAWLRDNAGRIPKSTKGEYYLTDLVAMAVAQGKEVRAVVASDPAEVMGVNDRVQLALADAILRRRFCEALMAQGVTIVDPATTYPGRWVQAGRDTVVHSGTHLRGRTLIGERCEIGPNSVLADAVIGDDCRVVASVLEQCEVASRVSIGPFSHLRPGARIESGARIGNYAEVKASSLGEGVQMHHFSYVGDAEVGAGTNIGAGTITCNYDGRTRKKHRTRIGKNVFLGSDTLLRAPVVVGDGAHTGAGAVVTRDVPPGKLAVGVPARVREDQGRAASEGTDRDEQGGAEHGS